jgi:hypothetical protein
MATKTADPTALITDVFVTSIKQGQELATAGVNAWVDVAGKAFAMPPMPSFDAVPAVDPQELVDLGFAFAEELLATQKQFATKVLEVVVPKPAKVA